MGNQTKMSPKATELNMSRMIIPVEEFKFKSGKLLAPRCAPKGSGIYGLLCLERPAFPALQLPEGWLFRIGSSKHLRTRLRPAARTILWDGTSRIKGQLDTGGLGGLLETLPGRLPPKNVCLAVTCGPNPQHAERLIDKIAYDLTGEYLAANVCKPAVTERSTPEGLAARAEGGVSLARAFLGDIFHEWATRGGTR